MPFGMYSVLLILCGDFVSVVRLADRYCPLPLPWCGYVLLIHNNHTSVPSAYSGLPLFFFPFLGSSPKQALPTDMVLPLDYIDQFSCSAFLILRY